MTLAAILVNVSDFSKFGLYTLKAPPPPLVRKVSYVKFSLTFMIYKIILYLARSV